MLLVVGIVLYSTLVQYVHSMLIIIMNNRVFSLHNRNFLAKRVIFSKPQEERDVSSKRETKAGSAMGRKNPPPPRLVLHARFSPFVLVSRALHSSEMITQWAQ